MTCRLKLEIPPTRKPALLVLHSVHNDTSRRGFRHKLPASNHFGCCNGWYRSTIRCGCQIPSNCRTYICTDQGPPVGLGGGSPVCAHPEIVAGNVTPKYKHMRGSLDLDASASRPPIQTRRSETTNNAKEKSGVVPWTWWLSIL